MKMRLLFFVLMLCTSAIAQTHSFETTGFSIMERTNGKWGKWSDVTPSKMIITLDTNKDRIVVYSQEIQLYRIMNYEPKEENDNDLVYGFSCADEDGFPVAISIITRKKQGNRKQMYITHKNVVLMYNIINHDPNKAAKKKKK
jgi:hypothetical protein